MSGLQLRPWREASDAPRLAQWCNQTGAAVRPALAEGETWLVLADASDQVQACLRVRARLGLSLPRYSYHLGRAVHAAAELGLFQCQATLLLGNDHTGESELADLACAPGLADPVAALRQLIAAALAQLAALPHGERVLVELAGPRDAAGRSPFWQGLGGFFYPADPDEAEARLGEAWRSHLAALLPRQTLYLSFLSESAQAAVGQVGAAGQLAEAALREAGFAFGRHLRIDDGGPIWERLLP